MSEPVPLEFFVQCLKKVPDPRSKKGVSHPFHTLLAIALLANVSTPTEIARWTKMHLTQLKKFFHFRKTGAPSGVTFSRVFQRLSLDDLQAAFAERPQGR